MTRRYTNPRLPLPVRLHSLVTEAAVSTARAHAKPRPTARQLIPFAAEATVKHNEDSISPHINWITGLINDQHF